MFEAKAADETTIPLGRLDEVQLAVYNAAIEGLFVPPTTRRTMRVGRDDFWSEDRSMIRANDNGRKQVSKRKPLPVKYSALITRGNEGGFVAIVPALPGCVSQGRTRRDALKNVREAAEAYVETLLEDGLAVPRELARDVVEFKVFTH